MPEEKEAQNESAYPTYSWKKEGAKADKRAVLEAAAGLVIGKKFKRLFKSDDVLDGGRLEVEERTRRGASKSDNE